MLLPSGNPYEEVLPLQSMILPQRFDISPPIWGVLRRFRCVQTSLTLPCIQEKNVDAYIACNVGPRKAWHH